LDKALFITKDFKSIRIQPQNRPDVFQHQPLLVLFHLKFSVKSTYHHRWNLNRSVSQELQKLLFQTDQMFCKCNENSFTFYF